MKEHQNDFDLKRWLDSLPETSLEEVLEESKKEQEKKLLEALRKEKDISDKELSQKMKQLLSLEKGRKVWKAKQLKGVKRKYKPGKKVVRKGYVDFYESTEAASNLVDFKIDRKIANMVKMRAGLILLSKLIDYIPKEKYEELLGSEYAKFLSREEQKKITRSKWNKEKNKLKKETQEEK